MTSSIHKYALDYWLERGLHWNEAEGKEARSGLMLGYSLPEILWSHGKCLDPADVEAEILDYTAFLNGLVEKLGEK